MFERDRLLPSNLLPTSLWNSSEDMISMPPILVTAYLDILNKNDLFTMARSRQSKESPVGGITQEDTNKHLAQAFDGSSARVQLAVIDPKNHANEASDSFIKCLSGNKLIIVDAPCGAGAATLTFLSVIADLREKQILPRIPLDVKLIGAEIAPSARVYAQDLTDQISIELEKQAIFLTKEFLPWDATSDSSTTDLVKRTIVSGVGYPKCLVVIANFSAFLNDSRFPRAEPQIQELLKYSSGESSLAIWIEPQTNKVINEGGLFTKLRRWTTKISQFLQLIPRADKDEFYATSEAKFRRPVNSDETPRVHLAVMSFTLKRPYEK